MLFLSFLHPRCASHGALFSKSHCSDWTSVHAYGKCASRAFLFLDPSLASLDLTRDCRLSRLRHNPSASQLIKVSLHGTSRWRQAFDRYQRSCVVCLERLSSIFCLWFRSRFSRKPPNRTSCCPCLPRCRSQWPQS